MGHVLSLGAPTTPTAAWRRRRPSGVRPQAAPGGPFIHLPLYFVSAKCCLQHPLWHAHVLPPSPYAHSPLHRTRSSPQLFVLYPALHSPGLGPTVSLTLFFCLLVAMLCFKHLPTDTPMLFSPNLTRPVYTFLAPARGLLGLCGAFVPCLIWCFTTRCGNPFHKQSDSPTIRHPAIRHPASDNPTTGTSLHKEMTKTNKPKARQSATWPT